MPHGAVLYGRWDELAKLDSLYHYFYGKDKIPAKLEPGNANYELAYSTLGITQYLAAARRLAPAAPARQREKHRSPRGVRHHETRKPP